VGILHDQLSVPIVLPNRIKDAVYHPFFFLVNDLTFFFVPLHQQHMWFMHAGAPPHFLLHIVGQYLNQTFGEQWIEREGPVNWPTRSTELNTSDFSLWGHLNFGVFSAD
jgi:hypothetical protein